MVSIVRWRSTRSGDGVIDICVICVIKEYTSDQKEVRSGHPRIWNNEPLDLHMFQLSNDVCLAKVDILSGVRYLCWVILCLNFQSEVHLVAL